MPDKLFLAGAAGAVGRRLVPMLIEAGYDVYGTTRSAERAGQLRAAGATPVVVDVYDMEALERELTRIRPAIVMHQLTDLPPGVAGAQLAARLAANARVRDEGTRNLVAAARAAGARRFIAQSICWLYAPGPQPYDEDRPLDHDSPERAVNVRGVTALERQTLESPPLAGLVLRYGLFYGPGTGNDKPKGPAPLHIDDAARAAVLAAASDAAGIFNVAEDTGYVSIARARAVLGWQPRPTSA